MLKHLQLGFIFKSSPHEIWKTKTYSENHLKQYNPYLTFIFWSRRAGHCFHLLLFFSLRLLLFTHFGDTQEANFFSSPHILA